MNVRRRFASTVGVFAVVLFLSLAIAASGIISLYTDRDVLTERDAGPLIAPIMFAVATVALYVQLVTLGLRRGSIIVTALVIAIVSYFLFLLSGSMLYSLGKGQLLIGLLFFGSNALGPFAIAIAVIAFVVAIAVLMLISYRDLGGAANTPRWWWENRDDRDRRV